MPPVRDQHGNPLPGEDDAQALSAAEVDDGLAALPGWERRGRALRRSVPVARDSVAALCEGVRNVVPDRQRLRLDEEGDGLTIMLHGEADLTPADLETAARIDAVLSGSATDRGSTG
jgi:hypothetical protein